ncbi:hypothetical protein [Burkholderia sp. SIMBA_062]|uniref:hypothetical protein n=1 Tax=Burkholderia sp. SIMBA_062 TaxID=3085803 RepID=UPI00397E75FC
MAEYVASTLIALCRHVAGRAATSGACGVAAVVLSSPSHITRLQRDRCRSSIVILNFVAAS